MFGKLLKNDIKAQWHSVSTIFLCVFCISALAEIFIMLSKNVLVKGLGGFVLLLALLFACIVVVIAVGIMFSKTLFGRAGYLTLTLPVKTRSLIWSKTLSGLFWVYSIYILFFAAMFLWIYQMSSFVGGDLLETAEELFTLLWGVNFRTMISSVIFYLIWFAVAIFTLVQCIYFGITCSNVSSISFLGNLGTVIITIVSVIILAFISGKIGDILPFGMVISGETVTLSSNVFETKRMATDFAYEFVFSGPIVLGALSCFLNIPITYMVKNKVNIK